MIICKVCKNEDVHYAKGMCMSCYRKDYLRGNPELRAKIKIAQQKRYRKLKRMEKLKNAKNESNI